jgi:hypothetical protein
MKLARRATDCSVLTKPTKMHADACFQPRQGKQRYDGHVFVWRPTFRVRRHEGLRPVLARCRCEPRRCAQDPRVRRGYSSASSGIIVKELDSSRATTIDSRR